MEVNDKTIGEIARQLGISGGGKAGSGIADKWASKSDAELERELMKLKKQLEANNISKEKQMSILRCIAPMLDSKQRERLKKVAEILSR